MDATVLPYSSFGTDHSRLPGGANKMLFPGSPGFQGCLGCVGAPAVGPSWGTEQPVALEEAPAGPQMGSVQGTECVKWAGTQVPTMIFMFKMIFSSYFSLVIFRFKCCM